MKVYECNFTIGKYDYNRETILVVAGSYAVAVDAANAHMREKHKYGDLRLSGIKEDERTVVTTNL